LDTTILSGTDINGNGIVDSGEKGALKIANSWGDYWKNDGYSWVAYDALKGQSEVEGSPKPQRSFLFHGDNIYKLSLKYIDSEPKVMARVTLETGNRRDINMTKAFSYKETPETKISYSTSIMGNGGNFAFDGTDTISPATIVLDYTDLSLTPAELENKNLHLGIADWQMNESGIKISAFDIYDAANNIKLLKGKRVPQEIKDNGYNASYIDSVDLSYVNSVYDSMYIRGSFNGWAASEMRLVSDYTWQVSGVSFSNGDDSGNPRFKFDVTGNWETNFGDNNGDGLAELFGKDIEVSPNTVYTITFNDNTKEYTVEASQAEGYADVYYSGELSIYPPIIGKSASLYKDGGFFKEVEISNAPHGAAYSFINNLPDGKLPAGT
jgi:hypothetical protein